MDPGIVPRQLEGLTQIEEMLIARVCPIMSVYRKHGGQRGYKGHVLNLPQDIQSFFNSLPSRASDLAVLVVRRHDVENTHRDFTVHQHRVLGAVLWLMTNNPYFKDVEIDCEPINYLPENGIPNSMRFVDDTEVSPHEDEDAGPPQEVVDNVDDNIIGESILGRERTLSIPQRQRQRKDQDTICETVNDEDPSDWPTNQGNVAERLPNGKYRCRFASQPRLPYWALDMKQRDQLLSQSNVYLHQHPADANMTIEELREMVNSMSSKQMVNQLQQHVSKVQGTNPYWYQRLQQLLALIEQKGCHTFFFTFSASDSYWPELQRLLQNEEDATRSARGKLSLTIRI